MTAKSGTDACQQRLVAMRLYQAGVFPSGPRVMRLLSSRSRRRCVAVETALREIRQKIPIAGSLDQFLNCSQARKRSTDVD